MNLEMLPEHVKRDIEDQSLEVLRLVSDDVVVIGGWGVRALAGPGHGRYTQDIDVVVGDEKIPELLERVKDTDLDLRSDDWGDTLYAPYLPRVDVEGIDEAILRSIEIRIELSGPIISEKATHHYFEFSLTETTEAQIALHNRNDYVHVRVPLVEHMAACKLGLPVDYKHNYDAAVLLNIVDPDTVIGVILTNDDWAKMVLRRHNKQVGRFKGVDRQERLLAQQKGIDVRNHIRKLKYIRDAIEVGVLDDRY
jgi:hypothetical protein